MLKSYDYVFVLWGNKFEETPATIFVTEMRKAGLRVKVVGLSHRRSSGTHGLTLLPDLTLDQAIPLANNATCLVIPCASQGAKQLRDDPRWRDFFDRAHSNKAQFVIGQLSETDATNLGLLKLPDRLTVYPDSEDLVEFAREMAGTLSTAI